MAGYAVWKSYGRVVLIVAVFAGGLSMGLTQGVINDVVVKTFKAVWMTVTASEGLFLAHDLISHGRVVK